MTEMLYASKISPLTLREFRISRIGCFFAEMTTEVHMDSVDRGFCCPPSAGLVPTDALTVGCIIRPPARIGRILRSSGWPEIKSPVVESVMVDMIDLTRIGLHNLAMHIGVFSVFTPRCIETFGSSFPSGSPIPLAQPRIISGINKGDLALRKWDQIVGWIKRLNNRCAVGAFLGHSLSDKRLRCSAALGF